MKIAVMQPYLFPYVGYFQLITAVDKFIILDDVNFINKGWINRNRLLINGEPSFFTVPLQKASQNKLIRDIQIAPDIKWRDTLLKTFQFNYSKAPYYNEVYPGLRELFSRDVNNIVELNYLSIQHTCCYLDIKTEIIPDPGRYENWHLNGQHRILDICIQQNADQYINPIGGMELYSRDLFEQACIKLVFLKSCAEPYTQFRHPFVPNLSILDMMMFCKPDEIKNNLLSKYKLI